MTLIELTINGERQQLESAVTLTRLLDLRGLGGKRVAVERNGAIVPRSRHADTAVTDGDRIEIVVAVGGG